MTAPETAALRFALGCALGAGVGLWWDALKPLARRHPHLADTLTVPVLWWAWLVHGFAVCQGDLRLGYTAALGVGWLGWELTLGRLATPLFGWLWDLLRRVLGLLTAPLFEIIKKFFKFLKKIFASGRKWVTIRWNNRRHLAAGTGGRSHAKDSEKAAPRQAGIPPQPTVDQGGGPVRRGVFYGGIVGPAGRDPG